MTSSPEHSAVPGVPACTRPGAGHQTPSQRERSRADYPHRVTTPPEQRPADHDPADRGAVDPLVGAALAGRYRLEALIGRGGMASVYRGVDLQLGRPVALKVFAAHAEGLDDPARRRSETALLASVEHRALVRLYDAASDPSTGRQFLVMELVDGADLREALKTGPLSSADAAAIAADLAEALHVIHARGIVHRDVKPANVLLEAAQLPSRTWNAKLADFGIARLVDDARLTGTGLLIGTAGYLSPEQVEGATAGPPADVYALGLVLLEALTGTAAFPGPAVESASARLVRDPEVPEALGPGWGALLRSMTARDPAARPSALEVAVAAARLGGAGHGATEAASATAAAGAAGAAIFDATEPLAARDATRVLSADDATLVLPSPGAAAVSEASDGTTRILPPALAAGGASRRGASGGGGRRALIGILVAAAAVLVALAIWAAIEASTVGTTGPADEPVPVPTRSAEPTVSPTPSPTPEEDEDEPGNSDDHRNDEKDKKGKGKEED